jgi:uncharacterized membrane protein
MAALSTGILKSTHTTGIISTAVAGTDYLVPGTTTSSIPEGTNLYFTNTRARSAISAGTGLSYNSSTGVCILGDGVNLLWNGSNALQIEDTGVNGGGYFGIGRSTNNFGQSSNIYYQTNGATKIVAGLSGSHSGSDLYYSISDGSGNILFDLYNSSHTGVGKFTSIAASSAVATDSSQNLVASATTATQLGYLANVTSDVQTQINSKQPSGSYLTAVTADSPLSGSGTSGSHLQVNLSGYVPTTTTVNGHALSSNVTVTQTDVGLSNVTNDSQVKKSSSSINGDLITWNGTTGDAIQNGYAVVTTLGSPGFDTNIATEKAVRSAIAGSTGNVNGPGSSTTGDLPKFADTTGKLLADSGVLYSNLVQTSGAGSVFEVPLTFSTGLTRSTNTITVNTSQNITTLSGLTTNGFVKTGSGTGALSVDTNTYLTGNQSITLSSDVTGSGTTSISTTIASGAVTLAKMANLAANSIIGNNTGYPATPLALSTSSTRSLLSINNVENTALYTWAGTANITTLGTIGTGTWTGSTITEAYGGTNQTSYVLGDMLYASATNTLSKLAGNTTSTKKFLRQTGTGSVSAAPAWDTVTKTDIGLANVENTALSTWAGTTNIATLGTITAGTWTASAIGVAYGGTGASSQTAYAVLCGGTTSTGAYQSIASVGTSGQVLTSNGASALPTFQTAGGGGRLLSVRVFTSSGTWTKPTGCTQAFSICVGGGQGGSSTYSSSNSGNGGAGGTACEKLVTSPGSTETVTIGAGGGGGNNGGGNPGGDSSFGTWCVAPGGGSSTTAVGDLVFSGEPGGNALSPASLTYSGKGGSSGLGFGFGGQNGVGTNQTGNVGKLYGGGGSGSTGSAPTTAAAGAAGIVIVYEYS